MDNKGGLGKGLSALFEKKNIDPNNPVQTGAEILSKQKFRVRIDKVKANPYQPREDFDEGKLKELSESIVAHGLLQPITVKIANDGNGYILISGERRLRAASMAGLHDIPAYVYDIKDESKEIFLQLALIENVQREDLNPMELSDSYQKLVDECSMTQEQIAVIVSKQRSTVANFLRLQKLPAQIKVSLRKNEISEGHARAILRFDNEENQIMLWKRILAEDLTVRKLEEITKKAVKQKKKKKTKDGDDAQNPELEVIENKLRLFFGTRVIIKPKTKQTGEIVIEYYSDDDFDRIIELTEKQQ
jgi:ParB family transcriptional regulator, chromosome partitioning protein